MKLESKAVLVETAEVDGAFGAIRSATDYAGATTAYEYDAFGRLTKIVKAGDSSAMPTVRYEYLVASPLSRIVTESRVISGKDGVERSETLLDGGGRERGTLTRDGERWILAGVSLFDARGGARRTLLPRATDAAGHAAPPLFDATPPGSDAFHDAVGREVRTRSRSGIETRTAYAPFATLHWDGGQTDSASAYEHTPTVERKDGLGRVVSHTKTLNGRELSSAYGYDASGALVSRTDPEGNVAQYGYDGRGRRVSVLVAVTAPERLVTADFAAANPYAYAKQSPLLAADRDGHFWHVAIGAALGALIGGGMEAGRQYFAHGKVEDWGRVGAAAAGGAVAGTIAALNPAAGLAAALEGGAVSNVASGVTERLVASHGKSAETLADVAIDAAIGAATAGVARGAGAVLKRGIGRLPRYVARTFERSEYSVERVSADREVFRAEGSQFERWFGTVEPGNALHAEQLYNIAQYGNDATKVSRYLIPSGTRVFKGAVAGGTGEQLFVPDPLAAGVRLMETRALARF